MTRTAQADGPASAAGERVREALSELRTTVLGPQILLGFQYEALFQPGFGKLASWRQQLSLAAFALLLVTLALVIAPTGLHQLSERGRRTIRQAAFSRRMIALCLAPFALAMGANVFLVAVGDLGVAGGSAAGAAAAALALFLWYGIEQMSKRPAAGPAAPERDVETPLRDRLADVMTETRIVLPGVQALLGFQFAAYLSSLFAELPSDARLAHGLSLALLLVSMVLLMTPAPFHRLAENGEDTPRVCRVGAACIVGALATLALGLAADFYVAIVVVSHSAAVAGAGAGVTALAGFIFWFGYPLLSRRPPASLRPASPNERKASS